MNDTEKSMYHKYCFSTKNGPYEFLNVDDWENKNYTLDTPRFKACMGFKNVVDLIDVKGDGNCGYYALVYGLKDNNIPETAEILKFNDTSIKLREQMYNY